MEVEVFVLCDAATDERGKLNVLGTFDTIGARETPVIHPQCAIATRVRFERIERGEHRVKVTVADADGQLVLRPLETGLRVGFPDHQPSHPYNMILNLQRLKFERFGEFTIDLAIDGRQEASLPLFVTEQKPPPDRREE
ncbi:MAG: hypothetical protein JSV91_05705 [Phycisphaerales bacterium]|nr:MAG: hypothetical protein JSV91_05705 [Phycisphaerales bacterium]